VAPKLLVSLEQWDIKAMPPMTFKRFVTQPNKQELSLFPHQLPQQQGTKKYLWPSSSVFFENDVWSISIWTSLRD
jgi:hypothetical protein